MTVRRMVGFPLDDSKIFDDPESSSAKFLTDCSVAPVVLELLG